MANHGGNVKTRTVFIPFIMAGVLLAAVPTRRGFAAAEEKEDESAAARTAVKRKPLVVMKQTEIKGRVFLVSDNAEDSTPAPAIAIEVRPKTAVQVLHRTATDAQGNYTLPSLDVGVYLLKVGLLNLELRVEPPGKRQEGAEHVSKTIYVFLPKEMIKPPEKP